MGVCIEQSGSSGLLTAYSARPKSPHFTGSIRNRFGPTYVSERDIRVDWDELFEFTRLYQLLLTANRPPRNTGRWSCLMSRCL